VNIAEMNFLPGEGSNEGNPKAFYKMEGKYLPTVYLIRA
jgi:hypothetical protein